jgi:Kef-type K+ transport system membrane component KefB
MAINIFTEISLVIVFATAIAMLMKRLKQPLIIGHIISGILLGPAVFSLIQSNETIELMGSFGIALLLFLVGLGLNPRIIKEVGRVSILTGLGQIIFTILAGLGVAYLFGYSFIPALYIAVALTFSSTIIILKLLTDKNEHNKLYGKISIGFLLVQDVVATIALLIAAASGAGSVDAGSIAILLARGVGLIGLTLLFSHYVIRPMGNFLSKSQEMLFLFAIAWGFGIASLFHAAGFSLEVGALVAGVSLASMNFAQEISSRLRPLRDFFIVVFFIALGAKLSFDGINSIFLQTIGFSALVLIGNPIIVMTIMGILGFTKKTGFKAGLAVAQISEFSLIFILLGLKNGQISDEVVSLVTLVGIVTIAISSYMITYADGLYKRLEKYLTIFERRKIKTEYETTAIYDAILVGYRKGGSGFVKVLKTLTKKNLVIDYDPEAIEELERKQIPYIYGDATDPELLEELNIAKTKLVISHIGDFDSNRQIVEFVTQKNEDVVIICHANSAHEAAELYGLGASYVMLPHYIGSEKISAFIKRNGFKKTEYRKFKDKHLGQLQHNFEAEELAKVNS